MNETAQKQLSRIEYLYSYDYSPKMDIDDFIDNNVDRLKSAYQEKFQTKEFPDENNQNVQKRIFEHACEVMQELYKDLIEDLKLEAKRAKYDE